MFLLLCGSNSIFAQEFFEESKDPVHSFRAPLVINAQTAEVPPLGGWEFYIRHRFGFSEMDRTIVTEFLGMDGIANIRFSFVFPVSRTFCAGIGRSKNGKTYDVEFKKLIFQQTSDNSTPLSMAAYADIGLNTDADMKIPKYAYFSDGKTRFENKFNHRLSYNSQLIISRKFGEIISLQISPVFIYRNLVPINEENHTIVCPVSGAIKLGLNSSFLFEYAYRFNNKPADGRYPASIAFEFGTVSHVFQIVVTSTKELAEQSAYSTEVSEYNKGNIAFGFNMKRTFWKKKKQNTGL